MARRFIDTGFFKDPFVRGLQGAYKGLYIYLFLDCSNAGIWNVELDVAKLRCGIEDSVSDEEIKEVFKDKIVEVEEGSKWFIKNYLKVQHNGLLKRNNKAHTSAIEELLKYGLIEEFQEGEFQLSEKIIKGLPRGLQDPKVMVKVKVEDKVEVNGNGKGKKSQKPIFPKKPFSEEEFMELKILKKEIQNEFTWKETLARNTKEVNSGFTLEILDAYLEQFFKIIENDGEETKTMEDCKKHFSRWLNIELKKLENEKSTGKAKYSTEYENDLKRRLKLI